MSSERESCFYLAEILQQTHRISDAVDNIKRGIDICPELSNSEFNLVSLVFKKAIQVPRNGIKYLDNILDENVSGETSFPKDHVIKTKTGLVRELTDICNDFINLIENLLLPKAKNPESMVNLLKLIGDYFRYISEVQNIPDRSEYVEKSLKHYERAVKVAQESLEPFSLVCVALSINYAVCLYEVGNNKEKAIEIGQKTLHDLSSNLNVYEGETLNEAKELITQIQDNLRNWT